MSRHWYKLAFLAAIAASTELARADVIEIKPGDHISIIGNTLADRMQHDGWLETDLHARFPQHKLVIRNLGFSGDELTLRLRSASFGSPDQWLTRTKTDVVFAFFGYNESFAGKRWIAGVQDSSGQLRQAHPWPEVQWEVGPSAGVVLADRRGAAARPRLARPLGYKRTAQALHRRDGRGGQGQRRRIRRSVRTGRRSVSRSAAEPLTINGVHLNERGNRRSCRGDPRPGLIPGQIDATENRLNKLRQAVLDKNLYWFNRYRTVDGYSIFGGRADLRFTDGQTNRVVAQREMEVLDVMTANRDKRIWAVAQGKDLVVDDSNTPPFIPGQDEQAWYRAQR